MTDTAMHLILSGQYSYSDLVSADDPDVVDHLTMLGRYPSRREREWLLARRDRWYRMRARKLAGA